MSLLFGFCVLVAWAAFHLPRSLAKSRRSAPPTLASRPGAGLLCGARSSGASPNGTTTCAVSKRGAAYLRACPSCSWPWECPTTPLGKYDGHSSHRARHGPGPQRLRAPSVPRPRARASRQERRRPTPSSSRPTAQSYCLLDRPAWSVFGLAHAGLGQWAAGSRLLPHGGPTGSRTISSCLSCWEKRYREKGDMPGAMAAWRRALQSAARLSRRQHQSWRGPRAIRRHR